MQPRVSEFIKQAVIEDWFRGLKRDYIAEKQGIGTGTVTNIIRDWVADLVDGDIADAMRYFAVAFRKLKLTIPQCALGARSGIMMKNLGIEENDFDAFISGTYKFLKQLAVDPKKMAYCIKQMEDLASTMPVKQIPQYISELDAKKKQLLQEIEELDLTKLDTQVKMLTALDKANVTQRDLEEYCELRKTIGEFAVFTDDPLAFLKSLIESRKKARTLT